MYDTDDTRTREGKLEWERKQTDMNRENRN